MRALKFLLDESAEARIAVFLTLLGYDATRIGRDYPPSLPDEVVLQLAHQENRILISNDKDFGELVVREERAHSGVVIFRFPLDSTGQQKIDAVQQLLDQHPDELDQLFVVTPQGIRIR